MTRLSAALWPQQPQAAPQAGAEWLQSFLMEKDLQVAGQGWLNMSQVCPGGQEGQGHLDLYQQRCGQQDQSCDCPPVLSTGEAKSQILCLVLGISLKTGL